MGRIAALLPPRQRGVYGATGARGRPPSEGSPEAPCDNRTRWEPVEEVRIARAPGFCYGVREAIDKAKEAAAAGKATHTLGQVVHNEGVIRDLQAIGILTVETLDDVDHGAAVVIRAHGVRPEVMERAEARGLEVIDGTCTWVIQEQRELAGSSRRATRSSCSGRRSIPRSSACSASRPTPSSSTRRRTGSDDPAAQEDGAHLARAPSRPGSSRSWRRYMVVAQPRAQDRQHGLPGHDPPPGGHARDRPARST